MNVAEIGDINVAGQGDIDVAVFWWMDYLHLVNITRPIIRPNFPFLGLNLNVVTLGDVKFVLHKVLYHGIQLIHFAFVSK